MNQLVAGALAGLAATVPMTAAMKLMHRRLPRGERYPLPPRRVTMSLADKAGVKQHLDESERRALTVAGHFAYGAAVGALYAPLARHVPLPPPLAGATYGLAVWAVSYLGWLPAAGLIAPATRHPARRNALMIAAHLVWGAAAGALVDRLQEVGRNYDATRRT